MANTVQDEIYRSFLEASQQQATQVTAASQSLADLIVRADQVRQDMAQQTAGAPNTVRSSASRTNSTSQSSSGSGVLSSVLGVFEDGLSPIAKGILSLFGGEDDTPAPAPLVKYALPPSISFEGAEVGGQLVNADYDQAGVARAYAAPLASTIQTAPASNPIVGSSVTAQTPQITVNVSAMDARSFMDRSSDIAAAVRDAMLNLNSINDVVSEL
jgi:hypothetical protein